MSMFADLINSMGSENFQGLLAIVITGLLGKNSWDVYRAKDIASKTDLDSHLSKLKKEMDDQLKEAKEELREIKESSLSKIKEEIKEIGSKTVHRLEKFESRVSEIHEKSESVSNKLDSFLDDLGRPKISRAELRRMKEEKI